MQNNRPMSYNTSRSTVESTTDHIYSIDWTRFAAAYTAVHFAVAVWMMYIQAFLTYPGLRIALGFDSFWTISEPFLYAAFFAPIVFPFFVILEHVPRLRRDYATTIVPLILFVIGGFVAFHLIAIGDVGYEEWMTTLSRASTEELAELVAVWVFGSSIFVILPGTAYAFARGNLIVPKRYRLHAIVAVAMIVAIPLAVGHLF